MATNEDSQPRKCARRTESTFIFQVAGRREKLSQEDLDRFPGSLLHDALKAADGDVLIPLPEDGPQRPLVPMICELYRGATLGRALLAALHANPAAFASGKLKLEDIDQSLDYFNLPPSFSRQSLDNLITDVTTFFDCNSAQAASGASGGEGSLDDVFSHSAALPSLYRLITAASARYTAYNVLHALKKQCSMWSLSCGHAFFILLAPNVGRYFSLEEPFSVPSCLMLHPLGFEAQDPQEDITECQDFVTALLRAQSSGPMSQECTPCIASCEDWKGKSIGIDGLLLAERVYRKLSAMDPTLYSAFCHDMLKNEMQKLNLSSSWFQCPLKVMEEKAYTGALDGQGRMADAVLVSGSVHVMAVSWLL